MNPADQSKKMSQIIAKCWEDAAFKQKLLADPVATLKAEGMQVPANLSIKAFENTESVFHLVIPAMSTELSEDELEMVSGGGATATPGGTCWAGNIWGKSAVNPVLNPTAAAAAAAAAGNAAKK